MNREKKWTPGPWKRTEGDEWTHDLHTETEFQGKWTVASCNGRRDEVVANKNLISAAPELVSEYEEAVMTVQRIHSELRIGNIEGAMRMSGRLACTKSTALAKAYGETS